MNAMSTNGLFNAKLNVVAFRVSPLLRKYDHPPLRIDA